MTRKFVTGEWGLVDLLDSVDSTNRYSLENLSPWHLVAALEQTAGRGRLGREWIVPRGASVSVSFTVPLPDDERAWGLVPLFIGEAVHRALKEVAPDCEIGLKWPNDILARDSDSQFRKLGGILCQVAPDNSGLLVAGVGLNIDQNREELPTAVSTSLKLLGQKCGRDDVLLKIASHVHEIAGLWQVPESRAELLAAVREHCSTIGSQVDVHLPDGSREGGVAVGIDDDGRLVVERSSETSGSQRTVRYSGGDVEHVRM